MQVSEGKSILAQGRIVWTSGDLFGGQIKKDDNNQPVLDEAGQPVKEYGFGLAIPKANINEIWQVMHEQAYAIYPSGQLPPDFAFKFKDGDGVDHNGQPFSAREGYAGCLVFALTTRLPIKWFKYESGQNFQVAEGIKCGDYVNVQVNIKAHGPKGRGKAGLFLNPMAVQLIGYGKEIVSVGTVNADAIFGTAAPQVPQGASATPIAPTSGMLVPNQAAPAPHHGVLPPQFQQPAAPVAQAAPMAAPAMGIPAAMPSMPGVPQQSAQQPSTMPGLPPSMPGMPS